MTALNRATHRRLMKLPQTSSVWEGDRRPLAPGMQSENGESGAEPEGLCILWVDGSEGVVRAMDVVTPDTGLEVVARTLLRAMESPHNPASPARPQKIVVRDREILFFLRGVLQDLEITLDYVPDLPLIDEIFNSFLSSIDQRQPQLPPQYAPQIMQQSSTLWQDAPWEVLSDHQILAIEINQFDLTTVYASVMGMLGMEYGVLFYRSIDSLKRFRERAIADESLEQMEEAFLKQDCLFVTFESATEDEEISLGSLSASEVEPVFGNLHPLEGLRSFLYDEEAGALLMILEALHRFMRQHRQKFENDAFPAVTSRYRLPAPAEAEGLPAQLSIKVSSLPDLATELLALENDEEESGESRSPFPIVRDDLVPENSFLSLGVVPWEMLEFLRSGAAYHQPQDVTAAGDGLPVVMIQTSRPKAKTLIEDLKAAGGLQGICFNPGADPLEGERYDLGLFQSGNGELHLFGEFGEDDPVHVAARKKWDQRCKKTQGYCGLIIARGLTGVSRGNPQFKDMVGLFEARSLTPKDLGLGTLQLSMAVDWM